MELYYSAGACSLAPHIICREAGLPIELVAVDLATKKTSAGADYLAINAKGYVPALRLDDGQVLTEVATVVQFLADYRADAGLAPPLGTFERYRLMELLTFVSSELHKGFAPLWDPKISEETKALVKAKLATRFDFLEKQLQGRDYLMGAKFSAADAYAFVVLNWANTARVDLSSYPNIRAFMARVAARPKVKEALRAEGLLKAA
jgi:glutathione S-transferase